MVRQQGSRKGIFSQLLLNAQQGIPATWLCRGSTDSTRIQSEGCQQALVEGLVKSRCGLCDATGRV